MYEYGSDTNLIDTVTRECLEEIGLEKKDVQLLGFLNPVKNRVYCLYLLLMNKE